MVLNKVLSKEQANARLARRLPVLAAGFCSAILLAGGWGNAGEAKAQQPGGLDVLRIRPNFYMIAGAGGNIGVQFGPDGAVVVDTGSQENAAKVIAEVRKLTNKPIRYIINTSAEADHVGGNKDVAAAGESVFAASPGQRPDGGVNQASAGASILAHENVLARLSAPTGKVSPFGAEWWATESFAEKRKYFYMNHEGIEVLHQPAAHSDGDSIVFFRISDVVMAGDVLDTTRFPVVDTAKGGSIQGEIAALNKLIELAIPPIPFVFQDGGTQVIPGHGHVYEQGDLVEYRDMVVTVRDVVQDMMKRGMTLDQIKAGNPALPFEKQYGAKTGAWTTNDFVEAIYKGLSKK